MWYLFTMEYYSAIKRKTFESVLMRWMNLEPILQSEFRKMVMITLYARQQKRHRCIEQSLDCVGESEGGMIWEDGIETCIIYVK